MSTRLPRNEIARLSKMDLDDLYELVGRELFVKGSEPATFRAAPYPRVRPDTRKRFVIRDFGPLRSQRYRQNVEKVIDRKSLIRAGRRFLVRSGEKFRKKICVNWNYCKKRGQYSDEVALSQAIVGFIGSAIPGLSLLALTGVVVILSKKGLDKLCGCPPRGRGKGGPKVGRIR